MLRKHFSLFTLFLIVFLDFLGYALILPVLTPIFLDPELSFLPKDYSNQTRTLLFGLVTAAYPIAQFFGAPIIGALSDRFGRKRMLTLTIFGTILGNLAFVIGFSFTNLYILVVGRLISGFMGGNAALANSIVGDVSSENEKSRNYGLIGLAMGLGIVLGPFIGGRLANHEWNFYWNIFGNIYDFTIRTTTLTPFYIATILSVFAIFSVIIFLHETLEENVRSKKEALNPLKVLYHAFRNSHFRIVYLMTFLLALSFNVFIYSLNIYLFHKFNFTPEQLGDFFAFSGLCLVIALGVINTFVSKHFKPSDVLKISLIGTAVTMILSLLPQRTITMYAVMPFLATFYGLSLANITALLSNHAGGDRQGEAFGVNQAIQSFVEGITPISSSLLLTLYIFAPTFLATFSALLCWIIFIFFFLERDKK